ncbi:MAG: LSM domain-containing protein [Acidilobaceae archaeon]
MSEIKPPLKYLRNALNSLVYVKLKDGTEYAGRLTSVDSLMNLVLEDSFEIKDGRNRTAKMGTLMIRGSMILFISFEPETFLTS